MAFWDDIKKQATATPVPPITPIPSPSQPVLSPIQFAKPKQPLGFWDQLKQNTPEPEPQAPEKLPKGEPFSFTNSSTKTAKSTPQTTETDTIKAITSGAMSFFDAIKFTAQNPGAVAKEIPEQFSKQLGQPFLRSTAGLGGFISQKPLTPDTPFLKSLYGTDKPLTVTRAGRELRGASPDEKSEGVLSYLDPTLGVFGGLLDATPTGRQIKTLFGLSREAKVIIAGTEDINLISKTLRREIPALEKKHADEFAKIFRFIKDPDDVDRSIQNLDFIMNKGKDVTPNTSPVKRLEIEGKAQPPAKAPVYEGDEDLTVKTLTKLVGRSTVSKQFISDLTNSPDFKQNEKDIIRDTLTDYPEGEDVPVKEFADKVKAELLPLEAYQTGNVTAHGTNVDARYEQVTLPSNVRGEVKNYDERVYESPIKTSAGGIHFNQKETPKYFGHTRVEDMADDSTRRVIEVQSDLYQKGNLENSVARATLPEGGAIKKTDLPGIDKLKQYNNPTAHFRMVREEVKQAAQEGKTKLQFPTGETAMKIEGLGQGDNNRFTFSSKNDFSANLSEANLKVGLEIAEDGDRGSQWIITDVLGEGKFKAVPKNTLLKRNPQPSYDNYKEINGQYYQKNFAESFDISGKVDTNNPIYRFYEKDLGRYLKNKYGAKIITDSKGVTWNEVEVSPEEAKKPVEAFQKKSTGKKTDKETIKSLIFKEIPEKDVKLIFSDDFIDGKYVGKYTGVRDIVKDTLKPLIELYEDGGGIRVKTAYHEAGHYLFDNFVSSTEKREILDLAKKEISSVDRVKYFVRGYKGEDKILEEYVMDKYAEQKTRDAGFKGPFETFFEKIDNIIKKIIDTVKKAYQRFKEIPNRQGGFASFGGKERTPNRVLNEGEIQSLKDETSRLKEQIKTASPIARTPMIMRITQITKQLRQQGAIKSSMEARSKNQGTLGETRTLNKSLRTGSPVLPDESKKTVFREGLEPPTSPVSKERSTLELPERPDILPQTSVKPVDNFVLENNREDRLLIEKGLREINKIDQKESFTKSLKVELPKNLTDRAQELSFRKEAMDENPFNRLTKYMSKTGEFAGGLGEVTSKGKGIWSHRGDTIIMEATGMNDLEEARAKFLDFIKQKKTLEHDIKEFQIEKQEFLKEARGKRDDILSEKKVERMTARTDKHISELVDTEAKKKAHIKKAQEAIEASRESQRLEAEASARYQKIVSDAHIKESDKKTLLGKFKAIFSPISQTDPTTIGIYEDWEKAKLTAKEEGNKTYEEFKAKPDNDLPSIIDYEDGSQTPWIRESFDNFFTEAKRAGLDFHYKENYIPHVYNEKPEVIKKAVIKYMEDQEVAKDIIDEFEKTGEIPETIAIRLKMRPSFQRIRTFPDYKTAMKYGLTPKFNTVAEHLAYYKEEMGKVLANKRLIDDLISKGKILDAYDAPESWVEVKLPGGLRRTYFADPHLADALNGQFRDEENLSFSQELFKRVGSASKLMQEIKLSAGIPGTNINFFSIGQAVKMITTGMGDLAKFNPKSASTSLKASMSFIRANFNSASIRWMKNNQKYIDIMADNNLGLTNRVDDYNRSHSTWSNILTSQNLKNSIKSLKAPLKEVFNKKTLGKEFFSQIGKGVVETIDSRAMGIGKEIFDKSFNEKTFNSMMPQMQIQVFKDIYEGALKNGLGEAEAGKFASQAVKNEFGILNDLGRTRSVKDVFSSLFFAPKFREGIINIFINAAKGSTSKIFDKTYARNRSFLIGMILSYIAYDYINQKLNNGENMMDNESGHEFDLKGTLPNGTIIYTPFMPSVLSFVRNMASAGINFAQGRNDVALQKAGTLFSMPVKTVSEIVSNQDYFGRPIYDLADDATTKAKKAIEHIGLSVTHPYFAELIKYFEGKQNIYKTLVMMTELPLKFSDQDKSAISRYYEKQQAKTEVNAKERKKIEDMVKVYDEVQKLKETGKTSQITPIVDGLSEEEYSQYKIIMTYDHIQALKQAKQYDEAKVVGDALTDAEYLQYEAVKSLRTSQKRKATILKKAKEVI